MGYRNLDEGNRDEEVKKWQIWAEEKSCSKEEARLRKIIGSACLRLTRLDSSNPEVNHAVKILEGAIRGGQGSWP